MSEVLHPWPYKKGAEFMTPDAVWSAYLHEHRMRRLWEIELAHCAKRIHNQRAEINRLAAEVESLRAKRVPLTDEQAHQLWCESMVPDQRTAIDLIRRTERAHGIDAARAEAKPEGGA